MEPRKKLVISILLIALYIVMPFIWGLLVGSNVIIALPQNATTNQTALHQGQIDNLVACVTIVNYIILFIAVGLIVSVLRSLPKTRIESPITPAPVPKPKNNVEPERTKQKSGGIWKTLNREIGAPPPLPVRPVPVREPGVILCPDCKHQYYYKPGMIRCPFCKRSF